MTYNFNNVADAFWQDTPLSKIYGRGGYLLWEKKQPQPIDYSSLPLSMEALTNGYIQFTKVYGLTSTAPTNTILYNKNNTGWTSISNDSNNTIQVQQGDIIQFKGYNSSYIYNNIVDSGNTDSQHDNDFRCNLYGNIMSLIDGDNYISLTSLSQNGVFNSLFRNLNVVSAENLVLPATTLTNDCYSCLFLNCKQLVTPPKILPADTLKDSCYSEMFMQCPKLSSCPELPATNLAALCYEYMFEDCRSIVSAPTLPATILKPWCYSRMFYKCINLSAAPYLLAPTLETRCYSEMFGKCSSLNYIKCLATDISASNCLWQWTLDTSSTGTFVKAAGVNWPTGNDGIPTGWAVQEV